MTDTVIRNITIDDYPRIIPLVNDWWGGRPMSGLLPRLFFQHFQDTSFVALQDHQIVGFVVGFISQTDPTQGYIHFVGVSPQNRNQGVGELLYDAYFSTARRCGAHRVSCLTSPANQLSIAFHQRVGFDITPGDTLVEGIQTHRDYDGPGEDRVLFSRAI